VPALKAGLTTEGAEGAEEGGVNMGEGCRSWRTERLRGLKGNCSTQRRKGAEAQRGVGHKGGVQRSAGRVVRGGNGEAQRGANREGGISGSERSVMALALNARFATSQCSTRRLSIPSTTSSDLEWPGLVHGRSEARSVW